jgi:TrmH family RNA methyltransferase
MRSPGHRLYRIRKLSRITVKSITSRDNPLFKELRKLASSASARKQVSQTLLDGIHLCESYLENGLKPLRCIVSETANRNAEVAAIFAQCEEKGSACVIFSEALFSSIAQVEKGVNILFQIEIPAVVETDSHAYLRDSNCSVLLVENIQDPGNLGSMLRSAAAAGIGAVFCSRGSAAAWSPKVLRAGMGAHFLLKIVENADLMSFIRGTTIPVIATSPRATQSIYATDLRQPVAWLFGHEGQGVSDALRALASHSVLIPQPGKMESLNVAASAAICFFEQVRQRSPSEKISINHDLASITNKH